MVVITRNYIVGRASKALRKIYINMNMQYQTLSISKNFDSMFPKYLKSQFTGEDNLLKLADLSVLTDHGELKPTELSGITVKPDFTRFKIPCATTGVFPDADVKSPSTWAMCESFGANICNKIGNLSTRRFSILWHTSLTTVSIFSNLSLYRVYCG